MFIPYQTPIDKTAARIKKLVTEVTVLNKDWFKEKKKEFGKLCDKGDNFYTIDHTPDNYGEYLQSLSPVERSSGSNDFIDVVDFDKFCFFTQYSHGKVCGESVADKIIAATSEIITDTGANDDYKTFKAWVNNWIDKIKVGVGEERQRLLALNNNAEYAATIEECIRKGFWKLDNSFNEKLIALEQTHISKSTEIKAAKKRIKSKVDSKLTFGFNGDKKRLHERLKIVQIQIELLNEAKCSIEDFVSILTTRDIMALNKPITLSCEVTQFAYVITKLKGYFNDKLNGQFSKPLFRIIGKSEMFFSKYGTTITDNNLDVAKAKSPTPKEYERIDEIFKK